MGNFLSNKKYTKLDEYAHYAGYTDNSDIAIHNFNNDIVNVKQMTQTVFNDLQLKNTNLRNKCNELEKIISNQNQKILQIENKYESMEIHIDSITKLLDSRLESFNKDLEALLNNDKLLLNKIEELHPELKSNNQINSIKNSFLESHTEYSSFINEN